MLSGSAILIVAAAAGGYFFATKSYSLKYRVVRESGHRLYLTSLTVGLLLLIPASLLIEIFYALCSNTGKICIKVSEFQHILLLSGFTVIFGYVFAYLSNKLIPHTQSKNLIKEWKKNDFDNIYRLAEIEPNPPHNPHPLKVTLDTRKVYVGIPGRSREPNPENSHISIIPIMSGYQDGTTLEFRVKTIYTEFEEVLRQKKTIDRDASMRFSIVIPIDRIVSIKFYQVK